MPALNQTHLIFARKPELSGISFLYQLNKHLQYNTTLSYCKHEPRHTHFFFSFCFDFSKKKQPLSKIHSIGLSLSPPCDNRQVLSKVPIHTYLPISNKISLNNTDKKTDKKPHTHTSTLQGPVAINILLIRVNKLIKKTLNHASFADFSTC